MILTFSYDHTQRRMLGSTHIYICVAVCVQCVETPHECECMFRVFLWKYRHVVVNFFVNMIDHTVCESNATNTDGCEQIRLQMRLNRPPM